MQAEVKEVQYSVPRLFHLVCLEMSLEKYISPFLTIHLRIVIILFCKKFPIYYAVEKYIGMSF